MDSKDLKEPRRSRKNKIVEVGGGLMIKAKRSVRLIISGEKKVRFISLKKFNSIPLSLTVYL